MFDVWFTLFALAFCCRFLFRLILNRKHFGNLEFSLHLCANVLSFYFLFSRFFFCFLLFRRKRKQKRKTRIFAVFAWKRPFLSQIKCWFSAIYRYIGQITPHPPLLALAGWVSSLPKIFYFLFFVKYSDFLNFAFLPNFEHFWEHHIYFSFCIKFHSIYFWLFLCVRWRFIQFYGVVYRQSILNVLELNYRAFCINFRFCGKVWIFSSLRYVFAI